MRNRERNLTRLGLSAALAFAMAACSKDTVGPGHSTLTQAEADVLAQAVTADVDAMLQGAEMTNSAALPLPAAPLELGDHLEARCVPDRSPTPPQNSDADPVPDSLRLDFAGCVVSTPRATITYSGTIDIIDPTPVDADFAVKTVYTAFTRNHTLLISGKTTSVTLNGVRSFLRNSSVLQHIDLAFRTDITFPDGSTAAHVKDWSSIFTADVAGSVSRGPLPSGTWAITGTSTWMRGGRSYALTVSTEPVLHYDASCTEAPRLDSGTLTVVVTRGDRTSTVSIEFTACGQYTVTRS